MAQSATAFDDKIFQAATAGKIVYATISAWDGKKTFESSRHGARKVVETLEIIDPKKLAFPKKYRRRLTMASIRFGTRINGLEAAWVNDDLISQVAPEFKAAEDQFYQELNDSFLPNLKQYHEEWANDPRNSDDRERILAVPLDTQAIGKRFAMIYGAIPAEPFMAMQSKIGIFNPDSIMGNTIDEIRLLIDASWGGDKDGAQVSRSVPVHSLLSDLIRKLNGIAPLCPRAAEIAQFIASVKPSLPMSGQIEGPSFWILKELMKALKDGDLLTSTATLEVKPSIVEESLPESVPDPAPAETEQLALKIEQDVVEVRQLSLQERLPQPMQSIESMNSMIDGFFAQAEVAIPRRSKPRLAA